MDVAEYGREVAKLASRVIQSESELVLKVTVYAKFLICQQVERIKVMKVLGVVRLSIYDKFLGKTRLRVKARPHFCAAHPPPSPISSKLLIQLIQ